MLSSGSLFWFVVLGSWFAAPELRTPNSHPAPGTENPEPRKLWVARAVGRWIMPGTCDLEWGMLADVADLEAHRTALTGHCYRMLGSPFDAEDAVQETMVRAWRSLNRFDGRSSLRTWLYRIATNVCLDALSDRSRRARPMEEGPASTVDGELESRPRNALARADRGCARPAG